MAFLKHPYIAVILLAAMTCRSMASPAVDLIERQITCDNVRVSGGYRMPNGQ